MAAAPAAVPVTPPPPPAAEMLAAVPVVRQSLGRETTVTGKLSFNAPTRIDGTLHGEARASDLLIIGEEGVVEGAVRAQQLLVLGRIQGEVHVDGKVEIASTGRVVGAIHSQFLVVQAGGLLDGDCRIKGK
jgi:cytoskeletal protein CcmA (bactofilin family)